MALKSIAVSSFFDCSEGIIARWRDEDITVSLFSLYYTWRNDLRLYNRTILTITIIMFIYTSTVATLLRFASGTNDTVGQLIKIRRTQMTMPTKWRLRHFFWLLSFQVEFHRALFKRTIFVKLKESWKYLQWECEIFIFLSVVS